ncbi:MAG: FAD-dependent oxidoreductase [Clostridia bacterium]|nr:FAD-dependent oxidoreductase [Clostridia bacterium]
MISYWVDSTKKTNFPKLNSNLSTDVCIIGGGMTGLATAYMLKDSGLKVTLLEASEVGMGVTANTTAKITSQHDLFYDYLIKSFGLDTAKKYLDSNEEAIQTIENIIKAENIDCNFEHQDAYVYTCSKDYIQKIKDETAAVKSLGLDAKLVTETSLPFNIKAAICFPNQAKFHPRKYILGLLPALKKVDIFEHSKVTNIKAENGRYKTYANGHAVDCKYLVLACHYPIKNFPGMYFLKMYQDKSYVIAVDTKKPLFDGMYISAEEPVTSFRTVDNLLLVGGSGHKTGANNIDLDKSYTNLENYIKSIYPDAEVKYRWTTEDCVPLDKIPYIGKFSKLFNNMYVATGYKKWGMTTSHVAAKIISDDILGKENKYASIYSATRLHPMKNSKAFGEILNQTVYSLAINKMRKPKLDYTEIQNNCGGIVNYHGRKIGLYKDENGKMYAVKPYCSHLGCELSWNNLEKTWDCPCHGSRFDYTGTIITEPTTKNLEKFDLEE